MLRLKVRISDGTVTLVPAEIRLEVQTGTSADLILNIHDIANPDLARVLSREGCQTILPAGTHLMSYVSTSEQSVRVVRDLPVIRPPGSVGVGYVEILTTQPLNLLFRPPRDPLLQECVCYIPALGKEVHSVNEAHTKISERFEPHRRSHHGNVFRRVFTVREFSGDGKWIPLEILRKEAQAAFEAETAKLLKEVANGRRKDHT